MEANTSQDKTSERNDEPNQNTTTEVPLPHNCEEILKYADSPLDRSSSKKLLEQLHAGVFLSEQRKKYWVDKESNCNCFVVFAEELSISYGEDKRYWRWPFLEDPSGEFLAAAELIMVDRLEVHGRFEIANLSPGTTYEIVFIVNIKDPMYMWSDPLNLRLTLPDGSKQEHKENFNEKPRRKWIQIPAGEFTSSVDKSGEMEFSLYEYEGGKWKRGLLIKGVSIRPKTSKYRVDKESNCNCFIVLARDLSITWGEDNRFWHWPLLKDSSDECIAVAELLNVCWLEVHGKFEIANLSPGTTYEIVFIVKLKDPAYGWENPVNLRLTLPDGSRQEHREFDGKAKRTMD